MRKIHKILIALSIVLIFQLLIASISYAAPPPACRRYHIVRPCETLFSIGRLYGVSPYAIARANHLWNPNLIYVGQCLVIPCGPPYPGPCPPGPPCCWRRHHVRPGETLFSIGRLYGVSPYAIARANGLANPDLIYACQWLCIPCGPPYPGPCCWDPAR